MSQVYARQAEAQAATLQSSGGIMDSNQLPPQGQQLPTGPGAIRQKSPGEESSDSEAGVKSRDAYMQEGLERPRTPKDDDDDQSESEIEHDDVPG